jgi:hypothetical protein
MAPGTACPVVIREYVKNGEKLPPCTWHRRVNGKNITVYPPVYKDWFDNQSREGTLGN